MYRRKQMIVYPDGYYMTFARRISEKGAMNFVAEQFRHVAKALVQSSWTPDKGEFAAKFKAALVSLVGEEEADWLLSEVT